MCAAATARVTHRAAPHRRAPTGARRPHRRAYGGGGCSGGEGAGALEGRGSGSAVAALLGSREASSRSLPSVRTPVRTCHPSAQADFEARRLEVRCGAKQLCSRGKRYVHVLQATVCRPTACLLALAAAAPGDVELSSLVRWPAPLV